MVTRVKYEFMSNEWFAKLDELVAAAGDLKIPQQMKAVEVNIIVKSATKGDVQVNLKEGLFSPGHRPTAAALLTLDEPLARKIFIDGDQAAGVAAFLSGEIKVEGGDAAYAQLVAMSSVEPSDPQKALTKQIAAITT